MEKIIQEIEQLIIRIQGSEEGTEEMNDAYQEFEKKAHYWLRTCCFRNLRNTYIPSDLAEDLSQNFHMKVFISRNQYTPGTNLKGWLNKIIVRLTIDFIKSERHRKVTRQIDYECEELLSEAYAKDRRLFRENYRCRPKKEVNKAPERARDKYDELREFLLEAFGMNEPED
tara:strand:- start:280 stop:792 length:513 start_codon:yes stop_codon:yes gene_type:complete